MPVAADTVHPKHTAETKASEPARYPAPPPHVPPAPKRETETCTCKPDMTPRWKMVLETIAVFIGLYVAFVYSGQLSQMIESNKLNRDANQLNRDAIYAQLRPWLGFQHSSILGSDHIQSSVKNFGKAVARRLVLRAFWIDERDRGIWTQPGNREEEFSLGFHKICDEAVNESRMPGVLKEPYRIVFPDEQVALDDVVISNQFNSKPTRFIAVCVAYQGIDAALPASTEPERHPLFPSGVFRTQALYEVTSTNDLKIVAAEAFEPLELWRVRRE